MPFIGPTSILITGPSGCGKTQFVRNLLRYRDCMFYPPPGRIVYCYLMDQELFRTMESEIPGIEFHQGVPDKDHYWDEKVHNILILDDLGPECVGSPHVANLFTAGSHHKNITLLFITQALFTRGTWSRLISLNSHYYVLFKSPRDSSIVSCLGRQCFPRDSKRLRDAYELGTSECHSYILLDLTQTTDDALRIRSNILPNEGNMIVYGT